MPRSKNSWWSKRAGKRTADTRPAAGQDAPDQSKTPASPPPQQEQAQDKAAPEGNQQTEAIKKGVYLSAVVYIEGMQPPAEDFVALAKKALADALPGEHGGLTLTLKSSHVENNLEDEGGQNIDDTQGDTGDAGGKAKSTKGKEDRFEF